MKKQCFKILVLLAVVLSMSAFSSCSKDDDGPNGASTYTAVDLGLSVKWATFNVGASSPEQYGNYYAWAETTPKSNYQWSNLKYGSGKNEEIFTKYVTDKEYGTVDKKSTLESGDDVANANWGGDWRMPTKNEMKELMTECTWTWVTQKGVDGFKVTGPNGKYIFLPAAGYYDEDGAEEAGSEGNYWTSSLNTGGPECAYELSFSDSGADMYYEYRCYGLTVRPVCK